MPERPSDIDILVSEVGPRDGLQSIARPMPTAVKHRWIAALAAAGIREIEVGSFVPPKLLPQMADAEDVVREAVKISGLTVLALAPNLKGAERGIAAGVHKLNFPVSASYEHSMANIRMTPEQAVEQVEFVRSEEHTSELQSQFHLVCRLLLEKKKKKKKVQDF